MKKLVFLLLIMLLPMIASAQWFSPDIPEEDEFLFLFERAIVSSMKVASVKKTEKVFVEESMATGWCKVKYTNSEGKEIEGYTKMQVLKPLDDVAAQMKEQRNNFTLGQWKVVTFVIIFIVIGLAALFMEFLGRWGLILQILAITVLCALEFWFLTQTEGFTFYLPSVVGWKKAATGFLFLVIFLGSQFFLWIMTLLRISVDALGTAMVGLALSVLTVVVAWLVVFFFAGGGKYDLWEKYIGIGYWILIGIVTITAMFSCNYFWERVLFLLVFVVGVVPLTILALEVLIGSVVVAGILFLIQVLLKGGSSKGGSSKGGSSSSEESYFDKHRRLQNDGYTRGGYKAP
ncbi:MAG: hypothetical protein FWH23_04605 [Bacteroidales bacterium]|nr:hypothetical protein [Bacteroidales bacterium]